MAYPTTLDVLTNKVDGVDYPEAADMNNLNDAVEALEAKVGITDSAVATSIEYILNNKIWPVGSVFTAVVATNPATLLGFGTWSQIAGGRVLIGQTDGDADFNVAKETGGAKTHTLTTAELATHTHIQNAHNHTATYTTDGENDAVGGDRNIQTDYRSPTGAGTKIIITNKTAVNQNAGSGTAHSIMNPYYTCYIWERTA